MLISYLQRYGNENILDFMFKKIWLYELLLNSVDSGFIQSIFPNLFQVADLIWVLVNMYLNNFALISF